MGELSVVCLGRSHLAACHLFDSLRSAVALRASIEIFALCATKLASFLLSTPGGRRGTLPKAHHAPTQPAPPPPRENWTVDPWTVQNPATMQPVCSTSFINVNLNKTVPLLLFSKKQTGIENRGKTNLALR